MILRRIANAIGQQNWFTVFIELMVVVVGILIAVQIDDWNNDRKDRAREAQYLAQILADLQIDIQENKMVQRAAIDRIASIVKVLKDAGATATLTERIQLNQREITIGAIPKFEELDLLIGPAQAMLDVRRFIETRHSYNDLISTGNFGLITDRELSRMLQTYYAEIDELHGFEEALWANFEHVNASRHRLGIGTAAQNAFGRDNDAALVEVVKRDPQLTAELESFASSSILQLWWVRQIEDFSKAVIAKIEAETSP